MKDYSQIDKALPGLHKEYKLGKLERTDLATDPVEQFARWLEAAVKAKVAKPDAMVLATASTSGAPSARVVLLKGFNADGFVFFSNYTSPKGRDLEANPRASILFFWPQQERQVRIEGRVRKLTAAESRRYFEGRSRDAQLASLICEQSRPIKSRQELEKRLARLRRQYEGKDIPCPPFWGGYRLVPTMFEFWQGREHRLNDRLRFRKRSGRWVIDRLQP
jgi:pyridoxamine 5'-phosphate oxidase